MRHRTEAAVSTAAAIVTVAVGAVLVTGGLCPGGGVAHAGGTLSVWFDLLAAFAFIAGGQSLVERHMRKIDARDEGWRFSAVTVGAFWTTLCAGAFKLGAPSWETPLTDPQTWFRRLTDTVYAPVQAALAMLAAFALVFALHGAARRRARALGPMLACAACVLAASTPIDLPIAGREGALAPACALAGAAYDALAAVGAGAQRALIIGIAIGVVSVSLRVLLRLEKLS